MIIMETKGLKLRLSAVDAGLAGPIISKVEEFIPEAEIILIRKLLQYLVGCLYK